MIYIYIYIYIESKSEGRARIIFDFPLFLWAEVAGWWSKLSWSARKAGAEGRQLAEVTWTELLVDFEITTGAKCQKPNGDEDESWGVRSLLLKKVVRAVLTARGGGPKAVDKHFGCNRRTTSLAPFGQHYLPGRDRRPVFAGGAATVKAVGVNACSWALSGSKEPPSKWKTNYQGFKLGQQRSEELRKRFHELLPASAHEARRRCRRKTSQQEWVTPATSCTSRPESDQHRLH